MSKLLPHGYTEDEVEDMAETFGIEPHKLNDALLYMWEKRAWQNRKPPKQEASDA